MLIKILLFAGMSESLYFQVFYGSGEVCHGPQGVDQSEFKSITKVVPRARERTWRSICKWLLPFKAFSFNQEQHDLSVMQSLIEVKYCFGS